uniref:Photosystem I assembly protein Ycf4 n=1 Tax=Johansenicoccus eremophilus TaxID=3068301 RepID=A0AA49R3N7_9CHLO|nr:photosystem I assembly protein Ycf4 [Chlorophyceae sp. KF-2023a]
MNLNSVSFAATRRYIIIGERRFSNFWWASTVLLGSLGFLYTGLSSYANIGVTQNLLNNASSVASNIVPFFPQGLLMSFYGTIGLLLSAYWWALISWNVGGGFNEFNKKENFVRVFRWGYPGKNRRIDLYYELKDVEAVRVEFKQGLDSQRTIYLRLKGSASMPQREIPLTGVGRPMAIREIEKQASELANFLKVSLEGV